MPRPGTRRRKAAPKSFWLPDTSPSSSEDSDFSYELGIHLAVTMTSRTPTSKRRRDPKKRAIPKSHPNPPKTKLRNPNASVISVDDSDDECISFVQSKSNDITESVHGKVDDFFKSSGLISDDEDQIVLLDTSTPKVGNIDVIEPCCSTSSASIEKVDDTEQVIVVEDDKNQINSLAEIENYCKETEDLLKNANAILEKFAGTSKKEEPQSLEKMESVKENNRQEKRLGECPVCYEDLSERQLMSTKCGHLFCKECIQKIADTIKKCPTCRKSVNKKNIIPIYI